MKRVRKTLALGLVVLLVGCSLAVDLSELDEGCGSGKKQCDGACVSSEDPDTGCGRSGCQPCALPHATPICSADGSCAIAACIGSFENCDDEAENGCETNLDTDLDHCGSCDARPCVVDNAEPACGSGSCAIRRCNTGFRDCDGMSRNGCELNTTINAAHCGACNTPCATDQECVASECVTP